MAVSCTSEKPATNQVTARLPYPRRVSRQILWRYAAPITLIHLLALLALHPWLFSWTGAAIWWAGISSFGGIGIDLCYHRLLTHRSFRTPLWLEHLLVGVALCCLEDAPGSWVATHRQHHHHPDEVEDPHSPLVNFFWSHLGWLYVENADVRCSNAFDHFARDILRDPFYMRLQRTLLPLWIYAAQALVYFLAGLGAGCWWSQSWQGGVQLGFSWLVWGCLLRTVSVWHISWSVNSLTHVFGYRNYDTPDNSRNNWLVAFFSIGEGWHNNHHYDPASAKNGHRWWEFDLIYRCIQGLEMLGLATHVVLPRHERQAPRSVGGGS